MYSILGQTAFSCHEIKWWTRLLRKLHCTTYKHHILQLDIVFMSLCMKCTSAQCSCNGNCLRTFAGYSLTTTFPYSPDLAPDYHLFHILNLLLSGKHFKEDGEKTLLPHDWHCNQHLYIMWAYKSAYPAMINASTMVGTMLKII